MNTYIEFRCQMNVSVDHDVSFTQDQIYGLEYFLNYNRKNTNHQ